MAGIHHITAIAGEPARLMDFYTRVLGLRLVKKTVNYDDPSTYHLYFADETGLPGSVLTFFLWERAGQGRGGVGLTQEILFRVPESALGYWTHRLVEEGVPHEAIEKRFGQSVLAFQDPDGLRLALVGIAGAETEPAWTGNGIDAAHAIRGFYGVRLLVEDAAATGAVLTSVLGFAESGREETVTRYAVASAGPGGVVEVRAAPGFLPGRSGRGTVHHVAFRATDDAEQARMRGKLIEQHQLSVTGQVERNYFRSIYFEEPGGILFEIATDEPGFLIDEPVSALGSNLMLPPFLEPHREAIEARLAPLEPDRVSSSRAHAPTL